MIAPRYAKRSAASAVTEMLVVGVRGTDAAMETFPFSPPAAGPINLDGKSMLILNCFGCVSWIINLATKPVCAHGARHSVRSFHRIRFRSYPLSSIVHCAAPVDRSFKKANPIFFLQRVNKQPTLNWKKYERS
jgi:hypothetical protein